MIPDLLEKAAFDYPAKSFFKYKDKTYTYSDINNYVNYLLDDNFLLPKDNKIGIRSYNPVVVLVGIFLCNRINKIPVVFSADQNVFSNCSEVARCNYVFTEKDCIIQYKFKSKFIGYKYSNNNVQCVLFTSGTSDKPKGVELTFSNIYESCKNWLDVYSFKKDDVYLNVLPLNHISGLSIFFRSLISNFSIICSKYNKDGIIKIISHNDVTCFSAIPKIIYDIFENKESIKVFKKLKFLLIGGDLINKDIFDHLVSNNINAYISYGLTETSSGVSGYWVKDVDCFESGFIGFPHKNTNFSIEDGCLKIASRTVMKKYLGGDLTRNIFLTKDKFTNKGNFFYFFGRSDRQIVSGGENINLNYLQNIINEKKICNIIISSCISDKWGEVVVAIYQSDVIDNNIVNNIKLFFEKNFPNFMFPKHIINIPIIPKLENKKIDYFNIKKYIERLVN